MARLICKFRKDNPPFTEQCTAHHDGPTDLSFSEQADGEEFVIRSLQDMSDKLKELGYDTTSIYFSVKTKK